jgi:hypothetical protein
LALTHARQFQNQIRALIDQAVREGELRKCATAKLANAVQSMMGGSLLGWAIHREGKADAWIVRDLDVLLRPYRRKSTEGTLGRTARLGLPSVKQLFRR